MFVTVRSVCGVKNVVESADAMRERGRRVLLEFVGHTVLRTYKHTMAQEIKTCAAFSHDERGRREVVGEHNRY